MTTFGKFVTQNTVWGLEKLRLLPTGTHDVGEALKTAGMSHSVCGSTSPLLTSPTCKADALVAGGQKKLFTPMMVCSIAISDTPPADPFSFLNSSSSAANPRSPRKRILKK